MKAEISYRKIANLPKLAWLASLDLDSNGLMVIHGSAVECHDHWMVEGVWDGEFSLGDFHRCENFFGSGLRIEGETIHFVPSSALVDRLIYCTHRRNLIVSNSLVLLLAFTGAHLDRSHDYGKEVKAILKGVKDYEKKFVVEHPEIESFFQVYHENIVVRDGEVSFESRTRVREIDSFEEYHKLLTDALLRIKNNYESRIRRVGVSAFTTLSSGYDSPAVSTLVRDLGVTTAFSSRKAYNIDRIRGWVTRQGIDDGKPLADVLGLTIIHLDPARSSVSEDELYFLAAGSPMALVIFHSMAKYIEKNCESAVVFTGFHGGTVWNVNLEEKYRSDQIARDVHAGFSLSEVRLKSGFINVAVPFMYARSVQSIVSISLSPEMEPWRQHKSYDRPIPRRIVEIAGVNRALFGQVKKHVAERYNYPRNRSLRREFLNFLRQEHGLSPAFVFAYVTINNIAYLRVINRVLRTLKRRHGAQRLRFAREFDFPYLLRTWATASLRQKMAEELRRNAATLQ